MGKDTCTEFAVMGIFDLGKFSYDITTLIDKTGEEQIANNLTSAFGYSSCMRIDTCTEFADLGIFGHDKFLYDIKTLIYKTEEEQIEINVLAEEERKNFINSLKSIHSENNIGYDMQYRFEDIAQKLTKFLKRDVTYWNTGNEEKEDTLVQEKDNFIQEDKVLKLSSSKDTERPAEDIKVFSGSKTSSEKTVKKLAEVLKLLCYFSISSKDTEKPAEDIKVFSGSKTSSEKTGKKLAEDIKFLSGSKTSSEKTGKKLAEDIKFLSGSKTSSENTGKKLAEKLQTVQNTAARIILRVPPSCSVPYTGYPFDPE